MTFVKGCAILLACVLGFTFVWVVLFLALYEYYPSTYLRYFGDGCSTRDPEDIGSSYGFVQGLLVGVALVVFLSRFSSRHEGEMSERQAPSAEEKLAPYASLPDWSGRTARLSRTTAKLTGPPRGLAIPTELHHHKMLSRRHLHQIDLRRELRHADCSSPLP